MGIRVNPSQISNMPTGKKLDSMLDIGMQLKMNTDDFKARANKTVFNWCINRNLPASQLEVLSTGFETNPDGTANYVANYVIGFFEKRIAYHECDKKAYIELIEEIEI